MSHDRCTRPHFHPVSLQAQRGSWHGPEHRHMDLQPRHAAAQVTLLEASFVFLPGLRRGENPSSEQHRQASKCCCRFASSSAEETDRIPVADQRSCAQPPTPTAPAPRALASAAAAERRAAAAASSRQQQRRAASGSSNGEQPCASSHIKLESKHRSTATINGCRDGASTVRRPSKVASKGGRPRRKAAQEFRFSARVQHVFSCPLFLPVSFPS